MLVISILRLSVQPKPLRASSRANQPGTFLCEIWQEELAVTQILKRKAKILFTLRWSILHFTPWPISWRLMQNYMIDIDIILKDITHMRNTSCCAVGLGTWKVSSGLGLNTYLLSFSDWVLFECCFSLKHGLHKTVQRVMRNWGWTKRMFL